MADLRDVIRMRKALEWCLPQLEIGANIFDLSNDKDVPLTEERAISQLAHVERFLRRIMDGNTDNFDEFIKLDQLVAK